MFEHITSRSEVVFVDLRAELGIGPDESIHPDYLGEEIWSHNLDLSLRDLGLHCQGECYAAASERVHLFLAAGPAQRAAVQEHDILDVHPVQDTVNSVVVQHYRSGGSFLNPGEDTPVLLSAEGKFFIIDGTHRIVAARLEGHNVMPVRLIQLQL